MMVNRSLAMGKFWFVETIYYISRLTPHGENKNTGHPENSKIATILNILQNQKTILVGVFFNNFLVE